MSNADEQAITGGEQRVLRALGVSSDDPATLLTHVFRSLPPAQSTAEADPAFVRAVMAQVAQLPYRGREAGRVRRLLVQLTRWWPPLRWPRGIPAELQPLISALAQAILAPFAPEELLLFPDTRDTYFAHPGRLLRRWPRLASPLAFGRPAEPDEIYWTPIVLEVSRGLAAYVTAQCPGALLPGALADPASVVTYVRQAFEAAAHAKPMDASRTVGSGAQVYALVIAQAQRFLPEAQARTLAEHTVRRLLGEDPAGATPCRADGAP